MSKPVIPYGYAIQPEAKEQVAVANWLDDRGVLWFHPPNGRYRRPSTGRQLKNEGVKAGVPDVVIFTRPPNKPEALGCVIELKRAEGRISLKDEQKFWLQALEELGWVAYVARGAKAAIEFLQELGY